MEHNKLAFFEPLWIDSYRNSHIVIRSNKPITWARRKVYTQHGVVFSTSEVKDIDVNISEKIENYKMLSSWSARRLTPAPG